jgi:hypothetical protein
VSLAGLRVEVEHFDLLEQEWANHPLLDLILWQEARVGFVMATTLPSDQVAGHAALAQLLRPVATSPDVLDDLHAVTATPELAGWSADEFHHGLGHVGANELARALTPLTIGLEGLIRKSAVTRQLLDQPAVDNLRSGSALVKTLWGGAGTYEPYMARWVFGMANVYRHGADRGSPDEQALHALCGAAIWAKHVLGEPTAFDQIQAGLARHVWASQADGTLTIQPDAEARLKRAAENAEQTEYVESILRLRDQLLELREGPVERVRSRSPDPGGPLGDQ